MTKLMIKRAYAPADEDDGYRILVDRLWPRGVSKEREHLDLWMKQIAPSTELRKAWSHDPNRIFEFAASYRRELDANPAVEELEQIIRDHPKVTLVYGARDPDVNHARLLRDYLEERMGSEA
ncbi:MULTISPECIES: DUF488 family protein [Bifidobacterium]|nr:MULTISPECIES: DUF488 family protein [Bifidobacterium]